jgi:hypothetical protein
MKRRDFISSSSPSDILRKLHQLGLHSDVLKLAYPDFQLILSAAYEVFEGNLPTDKTQPRWDEAAFSQEPYIEFIEILQEVDKFHASGAEQESSTLAISLQSAIKIVRRNLHSTNDEH